MSSGIDQGPAGCGCGGSGTICNAGIPAADLNLTWVQSTLGFPDCTQTAPMIYVPNVVIGLNTYDTWTSPIIVNCGGSRLPTYLSLICLGGEVSLSLFDASGETVLSILIFDPLPAFLLFAVDQLLDPNATYTITP